MIEVTVPREDETAMRALGHEEQEAQLLDMLEACPPLALVTSNGAYWLRVAQARRDERALDEVGKLLERRYIDESLALDVTPQEALALRACWRRIYRRMKENQEVLEQSGSVQVKDRTRRSRAQALRFRKREGGRVRQCSVYLGTDPVFVRMVHEVLCVWRMGKRMRDVKVNEGRGNGGERGGVAPDAHVPPVATEESN